VIVILMISGFTIVVDAGNIAANEMIDYLGATQSITSKLRDNQTTLDTIARNLGGAAKEGAATDEQLKNIGPTLSDVRDMVRHLPETLPESKPVSDEERRRVAVSSIVIRVTTSILLGFLVRVLFNLYRYIARLSAFYEARAAALSLAGSLDATVLERTATLLSPDSIDLGKMPDARSKQVVDILKQVASMYPGRQRGFFTWPSLGLVITNMSLSLCASQTAPRV
jgi:hypothetical protein